MMRSKIRRLFSWGFIALVPFVLEECDRALVPAPAGGGSYSAPGNSAPASSPMAPFFPSQSQPSDPGNIPGVQETHSVTDSEKCDEMEQRFRSQGRRVTLTQVIRNEAPNAILKYTCVFQGPDAQPGYFEDSRYNSRREYE